MADRAATRPVPQLAMLALGRPLDDSVLAVLISDAAALEEWLLARLDSDPTLGDCELRSLVQAVSAATATTGEAQAVRSLGRAGSELAELFIRFVTDCVCAALNPPCASCEDTDVLLACVEVRDCEVVRICNAERDYVVSGSALQYWLPVGLLHQLIESLCCPAKPRRDAIKEPAGLAFQKAGWDRDPRRPCRGNCSACRSPRRCCAMPSTEPASSFRSQPRRHRRRLRPLPNQLRIRRQPTRQPSRSPLSPSASPSSPISSTRPGCGLMSWPASLWPAPARPAPARRAPGRRALGRRAPARPPRHRG